MGTECTMGTGMASYPMVPALPWGQLGEASWPGKELAILPSCRAPPSSAGSFVLFTVNPNSSAVAVGGAGGGVGKRRAVIFETLPLLCEQSFQICVF